MNGCVIVIEVKLKLKMKLRNEIDIKLKLNNISLTPNTSPSKITTQTAHTPPTPPSLARQNHTDSSP